MNQNTSPQLKKQLQTTPFKMRKLFFFFLLLIASIQFVFAQDQAESETPDAKKAAEKAVPDEVILTASPHVTTSYIFPESAEEDFIIGDPVEVLFGLSNIGESPINVTQIAGSLRYPSDWRYYIQNFTKQFLSVIVRPGEQASFVYKFLPDPLLEPRDFGFSGQVFYHDFDGGNFTSYFFNGTIGLIESSETVDAQALFTYIGIVGVAGLVLFIIYKSVGDSKRTKRSAPKLETGTQKTDTIDEEWLEGTHAVKKAQRSPTKSRKEKNL